MKQLNKEEINKNLVNTINQYKVLQYLKSNLNIYEFNLFLYDKDTIKVIDKENKSAFFIYQDNTKDIIFVEEINDKEQDFEM